MLKRFVLVHLLILFSCLSGFSVNLKDNGLIIRVPLDYATIQEAVDAANPSDVVVVASGVYGENVTVNKSLTLVGEAVDTTVVNGSFSVVSGEVAIDNFTVRNGGGIDVQNVENVTIQSFDFASLAPSLSS